MNEDGDDKYWWKLSYLTSKWSKNENPEKSRNFFLNPGIKNIGKSRPEKSRDPGIWQNPVPKNPGIEILDPVRACSLSSAQDKTKYTGLHRLLTVQWASWVSLALASLLSADCSAQCLLRHIGLLEADEDKIRKIRPKGTLVTILYVPREAAPKLARILTKGSAFGFATALVCFLMCLL